MAKTKLSSKFRPFPFVVLPWFGTKKTTLWRGGGGARFQTSLGTSKWEGGSSFHPPLLSDSPCPLCPPSMEGCLVGWLGGGGTKKGGGGIKIEEKNLLSNSLWAIKSIFSPCYFFVFPFRKPSLMVTLLYRQGAFCLTVLYRHGGSCMMVLYRQGASCVTVLYRHGASCMTVLYRHIITTKRVMSI